MERRIKIAKFDKFINEANENISNEIVSEIRDMIEKTIESSGGNFDDFVKKYIETPDENQIYGFINDADVYDFYLKWSDDIDMTLSEVDFFSKSPMDENINSLYGYVVFGTRSAVSQIIEMEFLENTEEGGEA